MGGHAVIDDGINVETEFIKGTYLVDHGVRVAVRDELWDDAEIDVAGKAFADAATL